MAQNPEITPVTSKNAAITARWVDRLAKGELPVLRESAEALAELQQRVESVTAPELVRVILNDPFLCLRILQAANRQQSRHNANEITSMTQAVMKFGIDRFFERFSGMPIVEERLAQQEAVMLHLAGVIQRARHAATQARDFAAVRYDRDPEEASIAALLIDFPEMLLAVHTPKVITKLLEEERVQAPREVELRVMGVAVADLQQPLAIALGVPDKVRVLTDPNNTATPRIFGIHLASRIAHHLEHGAPLASLDADLQQAAEFLHISLEEMTQTVHINAQSVSRTLLPQEEKLAEQPVNQVRVEQALQDIGNHLDGTLTLHEMMMLAMTGLHEGAHLKRVVFALLTADRTQLRARLWLGIDPGDPLAGFVLALKPPHLFTRLLERTQAVWIRESLAQSPLAALLTPDLGAIITSGPFFAMSIFLHGKPIGIIYADQNGGAELDEARYALFKQLCGRAAEGLVHIAKATAKRAVPAV